MDQLELSIHARSQSFMRMPVKISLALAILALIAAAVLLGSPWMNQGFHMPAEKHPAPQREAAGSSKEPAASTSK